MVDAIEAAAFLVRASAVDPARAIDARYADELLRSIELLHAAIPRRAHAAAATFSAYRAPTAARSATPPRA
jgi:hypothetical protein